MLSFASVYEFTTYTNYKTSTTLLSIQKTLWAEQMPTLIQNYTKELKYKNTKP